MSIKKFYYKVLFQSKILGTQNSSQNLKEFLCDHSLEIFNKMQ
ncbi:hypothetical protein LEP1GSC124_3744 [Leptospira interrogans serovar Pyrogenes str. 200701872]|uniref:SLEI domain protein, PF07620 family n=1 Tax=Leptospira interrogans serovar Pyrogenes str. 200701872 TaxID=1193029 RepID=M6ZGA2_LEPIR|nr:hypothetical protein LEP1GSC124_3744 [Leptospira interrogans serovar Pyrogenes str. 200701872]